MVDEGSGTGLDVCEMEFFNEGDVYFNGKVGCWTDSGQDSRMLNARELKSDGDLGRRKNDCKMQSE